MGRVIEFQINGMKHTRAVEGKYYIHGYWSSPYYDGFNIWKRYLETSISFFESESESINVKIEEFNKVNSNLKIEIDNGDMIEWDGFDHYWEDLNENKAMITKVYPIVLIGCYTEFESMLRGICDSLYIFNSTIPAPTKLDNIDKCKKFLENKVEFIFSDDLLKIWERINLFRDMRNLFAHNNNPVDVTKSMEIERLQRIQTIDAENIIIDRHNLVIIKERKPILEFITLCDEFMNSLHSDLIKFQ